MTTTALLIPFDETKQPHLLELDPGLDAIYALVAPDSRMFEVTYGVSIELWGDEEGGPGMRNDAHLRVNARAMQLFAADHKVGLEAFVSPLCGDFLAVGRIDADGNPTDVPAWVQEFVFTWSNTPFNRAELS